MKNTRPRLDAKELVEEWKDCVWVDRMEVNRIAVCEMGMRQVYEDEEEIGAEGGQGEEDKEKEGKKKAKERVVDEIYHEIAGVNIMVTD